MPVLSLNSSQPRWADEPLPGDAQVSFHPAGHILGSAQIAVEAGGQRVTVSGDYARVANPSCAAWEPVPCDIFVTEATFGLPVFRHPPPAGEAQKLLASVAAFGAAYMSVVLIEPLADLAVLAGAKALHGLAKTGLVTPRLYNAA